jgi:starvation-inducible DNA-binding protein
MATTTTPKRSQAKEVSVEPAGSKKGRKHTLNVPPQLATPTDLKPEEVAAVSEAVNKHVADALALYVKYKNYHWHLASSHFRDYHLMFDEQAAEVLASVDILAERIRSIGGTSLRSISHVSRLQTIPDDDDDFVPADEMLKRLIDDNHKMAAALRESIEVTEEKRDSPTSNILEEVLDATEKRIWFLFEASQR